MVTVEVMPPSPIAPDHDPNLRCKRLSDSREALPCVSNKRLRRAPDRVAKHFGIAESTLFI